MRYRQAKKLLKLNGWRNKKQINSSSKIRMRHCNKFAIYRNYNFYTVLIYFKNHSAEHDLDTFNNQKNFKNKYLG